MKYDEWCKENCPYYPDCYGASVCNYVVSLLKEQEPVPPAKAYSGGGKTWWYVCGDCLTAINPNDKFCHECGRAVKWDGCEN